MKFQPGDASRAATNRRLRQFRFIPASNRRTSPVKLFHAAKLPAAAVDAAAPFHEAPTVALRPRLGVATMIALVALRLAIGWHFFSEGMKHYTDQAWSSEGFLRSAKGPLAAKYQAVLPDFHGWDELVRRPASRTLTKACHPKNGRPPPFASGRITSTSSLAFMPLMTNRRRMLRRHLRIGNVNCTPGSTNREALETHFHEARRLEPRR